MLVTTLMRTRAKADACGRCAASGPFPHLLRWVGPQRWAQGDAVLPRSPFPWVVSLLLHAALLCAIALVSGPAGRTSSPVPTSTGSALVLTLAPNDRPHRGTSVTKEISAIPEPNVGKLDEVDHVPITSTPAAQSEQEAVPVPLFTIDDAVYHPASELDHSPYPVSPVDIRFPDTPLLQSRVTGTLLLYIDADGTIARIETGESDLPPEFEAAAREAFAAARMHAGVLHGTPVRSLMKILVEFESR